MNRRVIYMELNRQSIDRAIKELREYKKWLLERSAAFLMTLAEEGVNIASAEFGQAEYDGTNDVTCHIEERGENKVAVVAVGSAALFIEFGTGVTYPDSHPEASKKGMVRGEFGQGKGKQTAWGYYGEPGTNGVAHEKPDGSVVIITRGNPANMCMEATVRELEQRFEEIARRVYV